MREATAIWTSMLVPGLGHLLARRRPVEAALLLTFTFLWGLLGIVQVFTLYSHYMHVTMEAWPGITAQVLLYAALHPLNGALASVSLVSDMRRATGHATTPAAPTAPAPAAPGSPEAP